VKTPTAGSRSLLLGLDIGTTGAKALLIAADGTVVAAGTAEYPLSTPRPGWAEQDPEAWWRAAVAAIGTALASAGVPAAAVAGVGLTGQMHGLVLLDAAGRVLRPCILWNDQRTARQCGEITRRVGAERLLAITGKPALTGFTAAKLLWVRDHEPGTWAAARHLLLPKDYVRWRLTGDHATDVTDASGTNLLDVGRRAWSAEVVDRLEIPPGWLPRVLESPEISGRVSAAAKSGLAAGTPVVAGAGDQAAQSVGTATIADGDVSVTIGTSGVVFAATGRYRPDPSGRLHAYCHAVPGRWHLMGVMLSAGGSLRWFRDTLGAAEVQAAAAGGPDAYELIDAQAAGVPAGAEGLLFLPYLSGERCPHADPDARGVFFGLSLRHTRAHLARAVLEGVTFGLRDSLDLLPGLGITPGILRFSGGGSRSELWRRLLADVAGLTVETVNSCQGAALGAALLGGVGAGVFADVATACARAVRVTASVRPGPDRGAYDDSYRRYRSLYPALRAEFAAAARPAG
jgi:xylulokinase